MRDGKDNEPVAISQLQKETGLFINKSGFFIHPKHGFLGGSPDGLIGKKGLVEIKCPQYINHVTADEITAGEKKNPKTLWKNHEINEKHHHYYQIQGQLEVTGRQYCLYYVWTPHGTALTKIKRNKTFWKKNMFPKLINFYWYCMLPELIDPRFERSMPLRKITPEGMDVEKKKD